MRLRTSQPVDNEPGGPATVTVEEASKRFAVVDVVDNPTFGEAFIVVDKQKPRHVRGYRNALKLADMPTTVELGSASTKWRKLLGADEYNTALQGLDGLETYDKMRRGDATVRGTLRLAKTPVLGARWVVAPFEEGNPVAQEQAEFAYDALFNLQTIDWSQIIQEALLMLDFGFYMFEKVWELKTWRGQQKWVWRKWAPRHPLSIAEDGFEYDRYGGPNGVWMAGWEDDGDNVFIPIDKLLVFTFDREAGNMEGISLLRSAYKHWYFKENLYKIDAIQKERHGIGVPLIKLPPGFSAQDKALAEELGRNLRANEQAFVVQPPNWEIIFMKVEGNPVDVMDSIEHHDTQIAKNVLVQFVNTGAAASKEQEITLFMKAVRFVADIITTVINQHAFPQLIDYNYPSPEGYPKLMVRRIGEAQDIRTLSFALRNAIGAGIVRADDELEKWFRNEMDAPPADPDSAREIPGRTGGTPQSPNVGTPRQGPPPNQPGQDRSGGDA